MAASGLADVTGVSITLAENAKDEQRYTVRLYFAEVEDIARGRRVFRVFLQGRAVLKSFDVLRETGVPNHLLVRDLSSGL